MERLAFITKRGVQTATMEHKGPTVEWREGRGQWFQDKAAWPNRHLHLLLRVMEGQVSPTTLGTGYACRVALTPCAIHISYASTSISKCPCPWSRLVQFLSRSLHGGVNWTSWLAARGEKHGPDQLTAMWTHPIDFCI